MEVSATKVFFLTLHDYQDGARLIAHRGGTRSGKTFNIVLFLTYLALSGHKHIDVVSESYPHLRRGAMKDFSEVVERLGVTCVENKTTSRFCFEGGGEVRFVSADDWGKVKGSRREVLFINEANRLPWETYRQLAVRTTGTIIIDFNPDEVFWYDEHLAAREGTREHTTTYLDNPFLTPEQVAEIESNKNDERWWRVYGEGKTGSAEDLVLTRWRQVSEVPVSARLLGYGLDFGFVADPTACVSLWQADGEVFVKEEIYERGLLNAQIAERLKALPRAMVVADSAELKSIAEIRAAGVRDIIPCRKGAGSVAAGLDLLRARELCVTADSVNLIKELRTYRYRRDPLTDTITNMPIDRDNHAIDALRYIATETLAARRGVGIKRVSF